MKTVPVSELSGLALDWAVAKCEGHLKGGFFAPCKLENGTLKNYAGEPDPYHDELPDYSPSSDWSLAGPIIEREKIDLFTEKGTPESWCASVARYQNGKRLVGWRIHAYGPTPLIAAMRCYVASKLDDTVEIPDELL